MRLQNLTEPVAVKLGRNQALRTVEDLKRGDVVYLYKSVDELFNSFLYRDAKLETEEMAAACKQLLVCRCWVVVNLSVLQEREREYARSQSSRIPEGFRH